MSNEWFEVSFIILVPAKCPLVPIFLLLSTRKEVADFEFAARAFEQAVKVKESDRVWCVVCDADPALKKGFLKSSIFDPHITIFLNCELHLRTNIDDKLKELAVLKSMRKHILEQIFGHEMADSELKTGSSSFCIWFA